LDREITCNALPPSQLPSPLRPCYRVLTPEHANHRYHPGGRRLARQCPRWPAAGCGSPCLSLCRWKFGLRRSFDLAAESDPHCHGDRRDGNLCPPATRRQLRSRRRLRLYLGTAAISAGYRRQSGAGRKRNQSCVVADRGESEFARPTAPRVSRTPPSISRGDHGRHSLRSGGFATGPTNVSSGTSAQSKLALENAFLNIPNLVDPPPAPRWRKLQRPPMASHRRRKLNTLANILAACVNSDGTVLACTSLFANTPATLGGSDYPSDTATAAHQTLRITRRPMPQISSTSRLPLAVCASPGECADRPDPPHHLCPGESRRQ